MKLLWSLIFLAALIAIWLLLWFIVLPFALNLIDASVQSVFGETALSDLISIITIGIIVMFVGNLASLLYGHKHQDYKYDEIKHVFKISLIIILAWAAFCVVMWLV